MVYTNSLQHRLVLYVSLSLLVFSMIAGGLIYRLDYGRELDRVTIFEQQLVRTVQAQAEVAVFADNRQIAEDVIEGLRANAHIYAVRIAADPPARFSVGAGFAPESIEPTSNVYPLFSPLNGSERIGSLTITRNNALIKAEATLSALRQVFLHLVQLFAAAILIVLFSRHLIGKPVSDLSLALADIQPGSGLRVSVPPAHAYDEIGSLAGSANALIEAAEKALAEVRELATTDSLTGLQNRRAFMARLENEMARVQRFELPPACVLMLDMDHFKAINDRHGHAAGDAVLAYFGRLLAGELRKVDTAGRLGGEEFGIILPGTEAAAALVFAERLRQKVAEATIAQGGLNLRVTISIGIAQMHTSDASHEDALARADHALYRAKETGRDRVVAHEREATRQPA